MSHWHQQRQVAARYLHSFSACLFLLVLLGASCLWVLQAEQCFGEAALPPPGRSQGAFGVPRVVCVSGFDVTSVVSSGFGLCPNGGDEAPVSTWHRIFKDKMKISQVSSWGESLFVLGSLWMDYENRTFMQKFPSCIFHPTNAVWVALAAGEMLLWNGLTGRLLSPPRAVNPSVFFPDLSANAGRHQQWVYCSAK